MRIKPMEVANDHLMRHDRQFYRTGVDRHMAWADDRMTLHERFDNDQPEDDSKTCFCSCNPLETPVLRNLNGIGKLTSVADSDMQDTTEQFSWKEPKKYKYDDTDTLASGVTPIPKKSKRPCRSRGRKNNPKP